VTMRTHRVYLSQPLMTGQETRIEASVAHYVLHVLRLTKGSELRLFNGQGGAYQATILDTGKHHCIVLVGEAIDNECESPLSVHLGLAIIKKDPMEIAIQKAVEMGTTQITPLLTDYTSVKGSMASKRLAHWQGVITSACEQCGRNQLPALNPVTPLPNWMDAMKPALQTGTPGIICEPGDEEQTGFVNWPSSPPSDTFLLIGPEGGFSATEYQAAISAGFLTLHLGPRILRAETAVIAALTCLQQKWGDLH